MTDRTELLKKAASERILVLDGGWGTMIQRYKLSEADYRGDRFRDWPRDVKGNNDLLNISQPQIVEDISLAYLAAGSDIIETNTFSSTTISQADYGMEGIVDELNIQGAKLARKAVNAIEKKDPSRPRFVAGSIGPTNRTASLSPDVNNPGLRNISFDELRLSYAQQVRALVQTDVDLLMVETIFDTLNAKAALFAIDEVFEELGVSVPILISGTITDASGRTLSGQTTEAFWNSVRHARPFAVGLNCSLGADLMRPYIAELSRLADCYVSAYPNAGLPNDMGDYDETPAMTSSQLGEWAESGLLNLVGGCCGTTPDHIRAIADAVKDKKPRVPAHPPVKLRLSGLEPLTVDA